MDHSLSSTVLDYKSCILFSLMVWTNILGSTFLNLHSLAETLVEQEELERCTAFEDSRDVHVSGQDLGFSHEDQEGTETTLPLCTYGSIPWAYIVVIGDQLVVISGKLQAIYGLDELTIIMHVAYS